MGMFSSLAFRPSPVFLMSFFVFANFFNYLDRGIIPGAASEFDAFIENSAEFGADDDNSKVDTYFGILQSSFIVGLSIAMPIFANLVHVQPPFRLVGIGLLVWCTSALIAGFSRSFNSYSLLVAARMLSGVGEASFQVVAAPYIQDHAGDSPGLWLGMYYTAIPFGTCVGYGYGAILASTSLTWAAAFWLEALMMAPLMLVCFVLPRDIHKKSRGSSSDQSDALVKTDPMLGVFADQNDSILNPPCNDRPISSAASDKSDFTNALLDMDSAAFESAIETSLSKPLFNNEAPPVSSIDTTPAAKPSIVEEACVCLSRPLFVWSMLGYAAYAGGILGFSTFGPQFVMGLGYFDEEFVASIVFGGCMAVAGLIGTPIGGLVIDATLQRRRERAGLRGPPLVGEVDAFGVPISFVNAAVLALQFNGLGALCCVAICFEMPKAVFFVAFGVAGLFLFASTATMNLAVLESVPPLNRPFAIAFSTLLMHLFGDVPSPIVVGALKGAIAPGCTPVKLDDGDDNGDVGISDECAGEREALLGVVSFIVAWIALSPLCYSISVILGKHAICRWPSCTPKQ